MTKQQIEVIEKYMETMPNDFGNRTLARKIIVDNAGLFNPDELENIRRAIRYRRGAVGKYSRKTAREKFVREEMKPSEYMEQYIKKGDKLAKEAWKLPEHNKKVLLISDLHIPYHDLESINTALDYGFKEGIDSIYINGDLIDFAKISRWEKDPNIKTVPVEVDMVREFLEGLSALNVDIYYKLGNHEDRWNSYLLGNAPELYNLDRFQISDVLGLDDLDIPLIDSKQRALFGHLNVVHGHEFGQSIFSPVNPARGLFLRAKTSVIAGHNHQTSSHHEGNLNGKQTACFSTGCLCDLEPMYRPFAYTKWNHGGAIVDVDGDSYSVQNFRIMDGRIVG
jgi:predicted phosphodiesterase